MQNRQQQIVRVGTLGVLTNIIVAAGKAAVGVVSGSMAIVFDAVNNMADALSSVITIVGVKLAGRPADARHPFGYGRIEYFTAVIIAALILVAGVTSLVESVKGIIAPTEQEYSVVGLAVIAATIAVKYALGIFTRRKGTALKSDSLISAGTESIIDCLVSGSTLISAALMMQFGWNVDSLLAAAIACLIIKAGVEMLVAPVRELLGMRSDPALTDAIKLAAREVEGVRGVYDVVIHNYGPEQNVGALHVEVDDTLTAPQMHRLTRLIQTRMVHRFGIVMTVGFYAHHGEGTVAAREEQVVRQHVMAIDGVVGMHGFYVSHDDRQLSFDIVYSFSVANPVELRQQVTDWLLDKYEGYDISIGLDRDYSES